MERVTSVMEWNEYNEKRGGKLIDTVTALNIINNKGKMI